MVLMYTPEHRITIAPASQMYQEETSLSSNWRFGLQNLMAVLGVLEMIVGVVFFTVLSVS